MIGRPIGLIGSSSLSARGSALYEPISGSAPDSVDLDIANPTGAIVSSAMLLDELGHSQAANAMRKAVEQVLLGGTRAADLGGSARCSEFSAKVCEALAAVLTVPVA